MQKLKARAFRWAVAADTAAIALAFALSFLIRYLQPVGTRAMLPYAVAITLICAVVWVASLAIHGAYQWSSAANGIIDTRTVFNSTLTAFAAVATISYVTRSEYPRFFVLVAFPIGAVLLVLGRRLVRQATFRQYARGEVRHCALVVGLPGEAHEIIDLVQSAPEVPINAACALEISDPTMGADELIDLVLEQIEVHHCQTVILDRGVLSSNALVSDLSWELDQQDVELLVVPNSLGNWASRLLLHRHPSLPLVQLSEPRLRPGQRFQKRALDLLIAVPATIALLPLMAFVGLLVLATSRGPIIFIQNRVGVDRRPFAFYKFRTMVDGAHDQRAEVLGLPDPDMPERYRNDPRVTPIGRFLRRYSLDELPQLLNVIVGDMSLVGPRPMMFEELPQLAAIHHRRHLAKPGLTGPWQISGRKETTWEERMALDLSYINSWSIALDIAILLKTFRVVLSGRGGY